MKHFPQISDVFQVDHFTRYGMHEYLEDEQLAKKLKRPPLRQNFPQVSTAFYFEVRLVFYVRYTPSPKKAKLQILKGYE